MHGLAHPVVATKRKRDVAHPTADLGPRQILFDPAGGFDKVQRVVVVLVDAGADGQNIWVEDDVFRRKPHVAY